MELFQNILKFLFPQRKEELYFPLKRILTFSPRNLELYKQALLHKSMFQMDEAGNEINNERLEFLGDAIIEAVVSNYLFRKYRKEQEGFLTTMRSKMVRRSTLGKLSKDIGLDKLVKASVSAESHNSYIGGNAFEALVGAAYLDRGYRCCQRFFMSLIERGYLNPKSLEQNEQNFKSLLLEWCQKYHLEIEFETQEYSSVNGKKPPFSSSVIIEGHLMGSGRGYSKKESHQQAAKIVLERLKNRARVSDHVIEDRYMRQVLTDVYKYYQSVKASDKSEFAMENLQEHGGVSDEI